MRGCTYQKNRYDSMRRYVFQIPLMMPVTVPRLLLLPLMDGSSARSAATAEVMMLLGPPTKQPMKAKSMSKMVTGIWSMYSANTYLEMVKNIERTGKKIELEVGLGKLIVTRILSSIRRQMEWTRTEGGKARP